MSSYSNALVQRENELRRPPDTLEQCVEERTRQLSRAYENLKEETREREQAEFRLRHAQKMEALGTMAGGIAHDFNNLLAAIIGFTELTIDDLSPGAPGYRYLKQVLNASLRARDLVKQMLMFSRKNEQGRKPLALSSMIKETEKLLRASIPSTIEIRTEINTESAVFADPVGVQQIVMNLCNNAGDAMRDTGGVLTIKVVDQVFRQSADEFDLVITDQTMPGMTGLQLARQIRAVRPDICIILTTGYSQLVTAESVQEAGIDAFVMKPLAKKELARTIRHVLDDKACGDETVARR